MRLVIAFLALLLPASAFAACSPSNAPPGSFGCQPSLGTPQSGDLLLGWRASAFPASAGTFPVSGLSALYLPLTGGTLTGPLSAPSLTLSGGGTALTVTNNAIIDGNLSGLQSVSISNGAASLTVGGSATAFKFSGVVLYAGGQGTITLSGPQSFPNQAAFWSAANLAGTFSGSIAVQSQIVVPSDTLAAAPGSASWLDVSGNINAGFTGNRSAISAELNIQGTNGTVPNDASRQWQAQILTAQIEANQGGTAPTSGSSAGFIYSGGDQTWCYSGATNLSGCVGREIDVGIQTGASAAERLGLSVYSFLNLQGNDRDDGVLIGVSAGAVGWKNGLVFSSASGATYGSLIGYDTGPGAATVTATYGINLSGVTFSTASLALPGLTVDPTGNITAPSLSLTGAGTALTVTNNASVGSLTTNGNGGVVGLTALGPSTFQAIATPSATNVTQFKNGPFGPVLFQMGGSNADIEPSVPINYSGGWTWSATNISPIGQDQTFSGNTSGPGAAFGAFLEQNDNSTNTGNGNGFEEWLNLTGSGVVGPRSGGLFKLYIAATTGNTSAQDYTALGSQCYFGATDPGGTPPSYSSCFGFNSVATAGAGVHEGQNVGAEIDTWEQSGAVITDRIGMQIVDVQGATYGVQASHDDVALSLNNQYAQSASLGFKVGLEFGRLGGYFPIDTTGTMIGVATVGGTMDAGIGLDFSAVTFSTASLKLPGLTVDPTGNITIAAPATGTAASYACFTSGGKLISSATAC